MKAIAPSPADRLPALLKQIFGYDSFRPLQQEIMTATLAGLDTVAIFPTGAGKSLCYQLPALVRDGLTVVVSPLIALMKDQVDQLHAAGVAPHKNAPLKWNGRTGEHILWKSPIARDPPAPAV